MIRFEIGDVRLTLLDGGVFRLDGGAMVGVVPRDLWSKERTPDSANRIPLALNVLLVEDGPKRVLIDTGVGTKWDSKNQEIYALEPKSAEELLAPAELRPEDTDVVVNSHLHFDHAGGNTRRVPRGGVEAAFPRATSWYSEENWRPRPTPMRGRGLRTSGTSLSRWFGRGASASWRATSGFV